MSNFLFLECANSYGMFQYDKWDEESIICVCMSYI